MQAGSSLSHHGRRQTKTGAQKKEHPLNTQNVVSIGLSTSVPFEPSSNSGILLLHNERASQRSANRSRILCGKSVVKPEMAYAPKGNVMNSPDFSIEGEGRCTVYLLRPLTPAAFDWIDEHIPDDAQRLGNAIAVEHRYIGPIAEHILADGLLIA